MNSGCNFKCLSAACAIGLSLYTFRLSIPDQLGKVVQAIFNFFVQIFCTKVFHNNKTARTNQSKECFQ